MNQGDRPVEGLVRVLGFLRFESKDMVSVLYVHLTKYPWHSSEKSNFQYPLPSVALKNTARWSSI